MVFDNDDKEIDENIEISPEYECAKLKEPFEQGHLKVCVRYLYYRKIYFPFSLV